MEEKKKDGFTLIELLVVIAIVVLTFYIVYPIVHHGPCGSPRVACAWTIHSIQMETTIFNQENEVWPNDNNWCDLLKPYIGENEKFWTCPSSKTGPCSYAMNENIPADANELPGDLVLLFESAPGWNQVGGADDVVTDRHGKPGANIAFADGHVEFVNAEDIPILRWTVDE